MVRAALIVVLVLVLPLGLLWLGQRRLIYLPDTATPPPAAEVFRGGRDVVLTTRDGLSLGAWVVPPTSGDRRMAILAAPGNGGNRAGRASLAQALAAEGFTVLLMEYRGYGGNPGSPTEEGLRLDARAARTYLVDAGWPADRILYLGESLGSAVVTELATEHPPAGLVLRSPFVDLAVGGAAQLPVLAGTPAAVGQASGGGPDGSDPRARSRGLRHGRLHHSARAEPGGRVTGGRGG